MAFAFLLLAAVLFAMGIVLIRYGLGLRSKVRDTQPKPTESIKGTAAP